MDQLDRLDNDVLRELQLMLADIAEAQAAISDMEAQIKLSEDRIDGTILALGDRISDRESLLNTAAYLYWRFPKIKVKSLAQAVLGKPNVHEFLRHMPPTQVGVACDRCGEEIHLSSRTQMQDALRRKSLSRVSWAEGYSIVCVPCKSEIFADRGEIYRQRAEAKADKIRALRSMPYQEYLQTPEWQERRQRHLKSAGYRCQVCNQAKGPLDVHHRTYERRGDEYYKDLLLLCRTCHEIFHTTGRLAKAPL